MLSKQHRIVQGDEYRHIARTGKRINGRYCLIHVAQTKVEAVARFGFIITKTVGKAHTRNLIRRRYKALAHELVKQGFSEADVVVRVHPQSAVASFAELRADFLTLFDKAGLLSQTAGGVL